MSQPMVANFLISGGTVKGQEWTSALPLSFKDTEIS